MTTSFVLAVRRALTPIVVLGAVTLTACSSSHPTGTVAYTSKGNGSSVATGATPGPSLTTSQPTVTADSLHARQTAQLQSAVRSFWDMYLRLGGRTGAFDGGGTRSVLAARTAGAELNRLLAYFSSNAASGYVVHGTVDLAPRVVSISGAVAHVSDCYDDHTGLFRVSDNQRVDADNPLRHRVLMTLALTRGVWKITAITDEGDGCRAA